MKIGVRLFGPLEVSTGSAALGPRDFGGVKPRQLFELLVVERGHAMSKDRLAEHLWADAPPRNVSATLETYVSLVRRQLGEAGRLLATEPGAYRIAREGLDVDLDAFDALRARAAAPRRAEAAARAAARTALEAAIALARGEVLEDEPYATWAARVRELYRRRLVEARLAAAELALDDGASEAALGHAEAVLTLDRACEAAYRVAMRAHQERGRVEEALEIFRRCRTALAEELGVEPSPQTVAQREALRRRGEPVAARPAAPARAPAAVADVPLLGRGDELARLDAAGRAALAGDAALVLVEGEAGGGKTRLIEELLARLEPRRRGRARAVALERDVAFAPLAEALRGLWGGASPEPDRYPALGDIVPELGGPGRAPRGARGRALESLVRWIDDHAPLALVLDDLQWADPSTLAALGYIQRRSARQGLLLLGAFRTEDVGPGHPVRDLRPDVHLVLQPLTRLELAPLGDEGLYDRTGGNALFVVEAVRARAAGHAAELPETLRELILSRSRAAGPAGHRALAVASVLGRSFAPGALARLLDEPPGVVLETLESLAARRLLSTAGDRFDFCHDLIREAHYASLSGPRRRYLHGLALDALEAAAAGPSELAHHAEAAGAHERALRYALRAAEEARARFANLEAVSHLERARRVVSAHPDLLEPAARDELLVRLGRLLVTVGRLDDGEARLAEGRALAAARGDGHALFDALEAQAVARHRGASRPSEAVPIAEEALALARRLGDPALLARAHTLVGSPLGSVGRLDEALDHYRRTLAEAERAGSEPPGFPMGRIALALHLQTRDAEAIVWTERAEEAARREHDEETVLMCRWVRALALAARGRYREAWTTLDGIAAVGRGEEIFWHARVPNTYGSILADVCLYERALERDLVSLEVNTGGSGLHQETALQSRLNVAADLLGLGRLEEARAELERVRAGAPGVEYARFRLLARLLAVDSELALAEGDAERARLAADGCLALADKHGQLKYRVRGDLAAARALAAEGRTAAARRLARAAARRADAAGLAGLAWRAWGAVHEIDGDGQALRRAQRAVLKAADGLEEPLRAEFLAAVPIER